MSISDKSISEIFEHPENILDIVDNSLFHINSIVLFNLSNLYL